MFDRAHMAVSAIKQDYHTITAWYEEGMREQVLWNKQVSNELKEALVQGRIRPWLQPIVDRNGKTVGAGAPWLAGCIRRTGIRQPSAFIPEFLSESVRIADVDLHIWHCCCSILRQWQQEGDDRFISVNIFPKDFSSSWTSGKS